MSVKKIIELFTKAELRNALSKQGKPYSGKKQELVDRLADNEDARSVLRLFYVYDLRNLCERRELSAKGTKDELIETIIQFSSTLLVDQESHSNTSSLEQLNQMVGLEGVKGHIRKIDALLKVQHIRSQQFGLESVKVTKHMVFTGNPGTGKTTVAKLVAEIFKDSNFLSNGQLIEATRTDFIGQYLGQSEEKTAAIFKKAKGGILFIDEAYAIFQGERDEFGKAILPAFLTNLEHQRDDMVVILAGYKENMDEFIDSDPGLKSRFSEYIDFDDFNESELLSMMNKLAESWDYKLDANLNEPLTTYFTQEKMDTNFSNGRFVRNLLEKLIQYHALRVSPTIDNTTEDELKTLTVEDLNALTSCNRVEKLQLEDAYA